MMGDRLFAVSPLKIEKHPQGVFLKIPSNNQLLVEKI